MYSFGPMPKFKKSGRIIGTHQKIDRIAKCHLRKLIGREAYFPTIKDILHFEGFRGPDGVKLKSPHVDEPWHFIDPKNIDRRLLDDVVEHSRNLVEALKIKDSIRASFEAAWLSHAVVDGLTPAHQLPYDEIMNDIRDESTIDMTKVKSKVIMPGNGSATQFVRNNWRYWGAKGLMTSHTLFEAGVASTIAPLKFENINLDELDIKRVANDGFEAYYVDAIYRVASFDMYERFKRNGWTSKLARLTKDELMPIILRSVVLAWYDAYKQANEPRP